MKMKDRTLLFFAAVCCAGTLAAAEPPPGSPSGGEDQNLETGKLVELNRNLLEKLSSSLVEADYFLKQDETGQRPEIQIGYLCPSCNSMHYNDTSTQIANERPWTTPGYAIASNEFIASDVGLLPDWYSRLEIRFGAKSYPAAVVGHYPERRCVLIRTEQPVPGIRPLQFQPEWKGKLFAFFTADEDGVRLAGTIPYSPTRIERQISTGKEWLKTPPNSLLVTPEGTVVALSMTDLLPFGAELFQPPSRWKFVPEEKWNAQLTALEKMLKENFFAATVRFSVEARKARLYQIEEQRREADAVAMRLPDGNVFINLLLSPTETARINRIILQVGDKTVTAKFVGSLPRFGGFVAKPESPLPGKGIEISSEDITTFRKQSIPTASIRVFGRRLDLRVIPEWLDQFEHGFRNTVFPSIPRGDSSYLFSPDGRLLALPLARRTLERQYGNGNFGTENAQLLAGELQNFDPDNIPRAPGAGNAWLGVDFQKLDENLARANRVSEFTRNGECGLLVTRVLPDSPAAKAGVKVGDILLGIQLPGQMLNLFEGYEFEEENMPFPWAQYDQIPAEYYDEIPTPWKGLDNALNQRFSQAGIGRKIKLSVISGGKVGQRDLTVSAAPENFDTTKKFNDAALGLSVANLTFEVRDYFKLKPEENGVVISRVRPGERAAVAGLKPYEIILSVNDTPVKNIEEFQKLTRNGGELKFTVRRFNKNRIVTITGEPRNSAAKK